MAKTKQEKNEYDKKYYWENRVRRLQYANNYNSLHKEEKKQRAKNYYFKNKERILELSRNYHSLHREERNERAKGYWLNHKEHLNECQKKYLNNKRRSQPLFRMRENLGNRMTQFFIKIKLNKPTRTEQLLGANYSIVKKHIELQFKEDMTWDNYGSWHIDHIIPLSSAKDLDGLIALCHYSNLQPLWASENISKGNKIDFIKNKDRHHEDCL